jgi:hypothetical protein
MYSGVPSTLPVTVSRPPPADFVAAAVAAALDIFANPKSSTFTRPSGVSLMLAGLTSRCVNALAMRRFQGLRHLTHYLQGFPHKHRAGSFQPFGQGFPFYQLEDQEVQSGGFIEPVNRRDVRVVQRGQHTRFAAEARQPLRVFTQFPGQRFDRDVAGELGVVG